jgi:hypothetical protein
MRFCFRFWALPTLLLPFLISEMTRADFIVPEFRGQPQTTYQEWDVFTSAFGGPNFPDFANNNPNGTATLTQTIPGGAFVTSGGNIYSPGTPTSFTVNVPDYGLGAGFVTSAFLQVRTLGTLLNTDSVTMNGVAAGSFALLSELPLGTFGVQQDWKFEWTNVPGNLSANTFEFSSASSSLSLARVSIDTLAAVPEPSSFFLLLVSTLPASTLVRRRMVGLMA